MVVQDVVGEVKNMENRWRLAEGYRIDRWRGIAKKCKSSNASLHFYHAIKGDKLKLNIEEADIKIAIYSLHVKKKYMYTYKYDKEENWSSYSRMANGQKEYTFNKECYFRLWVRGKKLGLFKRDTVSGDISKYASFEPIDRTEYDEKKDKHFHKVFDKEIDDTAKKVNKLTKKIDGMNIFLMSDSHIAVNGIFKDTTRTMKEVASLIDARAIVHLGDMTDGLMPYDITKDYVEEAFADLNTVGLPINFVRGNHDYNYFKGNPDKLADDKLDQLYGEGRYVKDYDDHKLRMIFLDSFDPFQKVRYGFDKRTLEYAKTALESTPKDYAVIMCSHAAPDGKLNYYGSNMRGDKELINIVNKFCKKRRNDFMGFLTGHNHGDRVDFNEGFPVVSIGCGKCESYDGYKPANVVAPARKLGHSTQELWDVVTIDTKNRKMHFTRFGAGEDKVVDCKHNRLEL